MLLRYFFRRLRIVLTIYFLCELEVNCEVVVEMRVWAKLLLKVHFFLQMDVY